MLAIVCASASFAAPDPSSSWFASAHGASSSASQSASSAAPQTTSSAAPNGASSAAASATQPGTSAVAAQSTVPDAAASEPPSRAMLRELTASPRLAGTCGSAWSAKLVARWLEDAGWNVEIDDREVLLSLPRSITLAAFDSAFSDQPILEHIDRFDPDAIPPGDLPKCNGWSASGDVRGLVVDAGYGLRADFERLKTLGIDVRGAIALVRYGKSYRGIKVDLATQYGCSAVLLFDDPVEDGPERGATWPAGPWKPDWDAQRGSISPMAHAPGDPSTPGWASGKHGDASVKRASKQEIDDSLPRIPCIPIGARDARTLLAKLDLVETKSADGKPKSERIGPGPVQAHLVVDQPRDMRTIHNVIARLSGKSEQCVIAGAHRDSWVRGANDDGAGTVLMLRAAQHLGERARAGWKPEHTILICLWDAEEFGMIGSTEWAEANAAWLEKNAIAYVNADTGVNGPHFRGASGTPGLLGTLKDVLRRVPAAPSADPAAQKTLWDEWCDGVRARAKNKDAEPRLSLPGSGSDFAVFLHHLSIPSLQFGFGDSETGQYHTTFDDFSAVDRYIDPGFVGHELAGTFAAELLFEISQRGADSFQPAEAAAELARRALEAADEILPQAPATAASETTDGKDAPAPLIDPALEQLAHALRSVSDALARGAKPDAPADVDASTASDATTKSDASAASRADEHSTATANTTAKHEASASAKHDASSNANTGSGAKHDASASSGASSHSGASPANDALSTRAISFYAALALPDGLPGRPWYRNRLWTPGLEDGYGSETFPTLRLAAKESAAALDRETQSLVNAIERWSAETARR